MRAGHRNRLVTIEQRITERDPAYNTEIVSWVPVASVMAEVQDMLPSRGERIAEGISIARRPCRVRMLYRDDVTSAMRLRIGSRLLRIVAGPAELGFHEGIELMAEELSTEGQEP